MPEVVYFVQAHATRNRTQLDTVSLQGPIKIGTTASLSQRLKVLRTGSPADLHVLAAIAGGRHLERLLHTAFAPLRHPQSEWFEPGETLLSFIEEIQPMSEETLCRKQAARRGRRVLSQGGAHHEP
jgi:hypothetical protein